MTDMDGIIEFAEAAMPWIAIAVLLAGYFVRLDEKESEDHE